MLGYSSVFGFRESTARFLMMPFRRLLRLVKRFAFRMRIKGLDRHGVRSETGQRRHFLFWVPGGLPLLLDVEAAIAVAVKLRGHEVHAVVCDGIAKACIKRDIKTNPDIDTWSQECVACRASCAAHLQSFNLKYSFTGDHVAPARIPELRSVASTVTWEELPTFKYEGVDIGANIKSSILRYLKGADYSGDRDLLREYVFSGLVTLVAAKSAFATHKPTNIFMSQGIYVDWGPALKAALEKGLRVTCWMASYLHARFYFRHPTDHTNLDFHNMDDSTWIKEKSPLAEAEANRLTDYMRKRYVHGLSFDIKAFKSYKGAADPLATRLAFRNGNKTWAIFAHINWDCVSDFAPMLFDDFNGWIISTLKRLETDRSVNWLLKVHPAEAWDNPATGVQALVKKHFGELPEHIRIVSYDEDVNPLDFYNLVDGAVTVYGTAGLELACLGKPVIVAGHAHYSRKGFTHDPSSQQEYYELLHSARNLGALTGDQRELAMRYAYIYFIQRQIPFPPVHNRRANSESSFWSFDIKSRSMLTPKGNRYVDFIVDRIVDGQEFILPNSLVSPK